MTLLTVHEMASRLQVKDKTIYAWVSQGKIPCMKLNGVIRLDERDIEQWLQRCHVSVGPRPMSSTRRWKGFAIGVDALIEGAKRAVYTTHGETRSIASPSRKEEMNGAR